MKQRSSWAITGLLLWIAVWVANVGLALTSEALLRSGHVGLALQPIVALLPAAPLPAGLLLYAVRIARMDELRQRLTVGAFALASAIVGIIVYGWSLLEGHWAGSLPTVWIMPAQLLLWGAFMLALRLRYP